MEENRKVDNKVKDKKDPKQESITEINNKIYEQRSKLRELEDKEELLTSISKTLEKVIETMNLSVSGRNVNYRLNEMYESNKSQRAKFTEAIEKERSAINNTIKQLNETKDKIKSSDEKDNKEDK